MRVDEFLMMICKIKNKGRTNVSVRPCLLVAITYQKS